MTENVQLSGGPLGSQIRRTDFPVEWGCPPGSQYSAERAAWVLEQVRKHMPLAEFRKRQAAARAVVTRQAILLVKRFAPGDEQR